MRQPKHAVSGRYAPPAPASTLTVTSADGSPLYVETHGPDGAPAVVLSHGWTCSTAFWAAVVRDLLPEHRVILYDQRGHGRSPVPAGRDGYSTTALADDLMAVLDATLAPGERAILAGHSMGGMTLMAAADRPGFQERAAAVLLCSTGARRLTEEAIVVPLRAGPLRTAVHRMILGSPAPLGPVTAPSRRLIRYGTMGRGATPGMVDACARIVHDCPRGVRKSWAKVLATLDVRALTERLTAPTAVIVGTADRLTPPVQARELAASLPNCIGLTELVGRGHMTPVEDPEAVTDAVRALVAEHLLQEESA